MGSRSALAPVKDGNLHSVVDIADDSTTVTSSPGFIVGVYVNTTLSAHALPIKDDMVTMFTIPASAAAGNYYELGNTEFLTSLVIDPDNAATGSITVVYQQYSNQ